MDDRKRLNRRFEVAAWGALFIWWGIVDPDFGILKTLPAGVGWLGVGLILLSLNLARLYFAMPTNGFTTTLGILTLLLGGLQLTRLVMHLSFDLPILAILLIAWGIILLARVMRRIAFEHNAPLPM